jgi:hypothetical protein
MESIGSCRVLRVGGAVEALFVVGVAGSMVEIVVHHGDGLSIFRLPRARLEDEGLGVPAEEEEEKPVSVPLPRPSQAVLCASLSPGPNPLLLVVTTDLQRREPGPDHPSSSSRALAIDCGSGKVVKDAELGTGGRGELTCAAVVLGGAVLGGTAGRDGAGGVLLWRAAEDGRWAVTRAWGGDLAVVSVAGRDEMDGGGRFVSLHADNTVAVWSLRERAPLFVSPGCVGPVGVSVSWTHPRVVSACLSDRTVVIVDPADDGARLVRQFLSPVEVRGAVALLEPGGDAGAWLVTASLAGRAQAYAVLAGDHHKVPTPVLCLQGQEGLPSQTPSTLSHSRAELPAENAPIGSRFTAISSLGVRAKGRPLLAMGTSGGLVILHPFQPAAPATVSAKCAICNAVFERLPDGADDLCKDCEVKGCEVCKSTTDDVNLLLCDVCPNGYHLYCLDPPLEQVPKGKWKCPVCLSKKRKTLEDDGTPRKRGRPRKVVVVEGGEGVTKAEEVAKNSKN